MFLHLIWFMMMEISLLFSALQGNLQEMLNAALTGAENAVSLTLRLSAGYLLFSGLMEIAGALRLPKLLEKGLRPLMGRLMPCTRQEKAREAVTMNLSMNLLGVGNAATPLGIEAVRLMDAQAESAGARRDLYMFLILNATSIQLLPTTVLTLRAAAGSADPNAVLLPTLACTAFSTAVGVGAGMICRLWGERHE